MKLRARKLIRKFSDGFSRTLDLLVQFWWWCEYVWENVILELVAIIIAGILLLAFIWCIAGGVILALVVLKN